MKYIVLLILAIALVGCSVPDCKTNKPCAQLSNPVVVPIFISHPMPIKEPVEPVEPHIFVGGEK